MSPILTQRDLQSLDVITVPSNEIAVTSVGNASELINVEHITDVPNLNQSGFSGIATNQAGRLTLDMGFFDVLESYPVIEREASQPSLRAINLEFRLKGEALVKEVASRGDCWMKDGSSSSSTWTETAIEVIDQALTYSIRTPLETRAFLVGVLNVIKDAKRNTEPSKLAAGFLVLACFSLKELENRVPIVNFSKTCDAGCNHENGVVRAAAFFTRESLGFEAVA